MIPALVLPALGAVALGVPAAWPRRSLHPSAVARALALVTAALALAVAAATATVAVGFLSGVPWIAEQLSWCRDVARTHDQVPLWLGLPALAALGWMGTRAVVAYRRARHKLWRSTGGGGVVVVEDDRPDAYAIGGRPGHVVVSQGMLGLLDEDERRALFAHERSHLRHRHHRHIALALVAEAACPLLGFATRRLRLAVERWADEDAAASVGDRRLVARAIITAALAKTDYGRDPGVGLALGAVGVRARVDALLLPAPAALPRPATAAAGVLATATAVVAGSALQLHHLLGFARHVCGL